MSQLIRSLWSDEQGQDIAEYAVMLAVILVLVVGTVRLIGSNSNNAFSSVASSLHKSPGYRALRPSSLTSPEEIL